MNMQIATLTEENIRSKHNNRDPHRVIRVKSFVDALGPSSTAEEFIEATSDVNETIRSIAEDLSQETRSVMMLGAIGLQREILLNFNLDSLRQKRRLMQPSGTQLTSLKYR